MPRHKKRYKAPAPVPEVAPAAAPLPEPISYPPKTAWKLLGISRSEFYEAVRSGKLPAETSRRPFLILRTDLEAYAKDRNSTALLGLGDEMMFGGGMGRRIRNHVTLDNVCRTTRYR